MTGRLAACCGEPVVNTAASELGLTHAFPTPCQLAKADLAAAGVPQGASEAIMSLATAAFADPLILDSFSDVEKVVMRLRTLTGMDEQTARRVAACGLAEPDPLPVAESVLIAAGLLARTSHWSPWRAHAVLHLWAAGHLAITPVAKEEVIDQHAA